MKEPDLASTMVLTVILGAVLVVGGIRARHLAVIGGAAVAAVTLFALLVPVAAGPDALVPRPVARQVEHRLPGHAVAHRARQRWMDRRRARREPGEVAVPSRRAHRLHLRDRRRGARPLRVPRSWSGCSLALAYLGVRTALRAPDRFGMLLAGGHHRVDRRAGRHQHRRGRRAAARSRASRCRSSRSAAPRWCSR